LCYYLNNHIEQHPFQQPVLTEKQQTSNNDILTTLRRQIEQKSIPHQAGIAENQLELPSPPLPIAQQRLSELDLCALDRGDSKPVLSLPENVSKFHLTNVQSTPAELLADITAGRAIISTPPSIPLRQRSSSLHSSTSSVAIDPNDVNVGTPPPIIPRRTSSARRQ
jgi:hypothetical protein